MSHNIDLAQLDSARQVEYRKKFQMVKQSLISIGFSMDDVQSIFTILSAILHIGDVSFIPHGSNDGVRVKNQGTIDKSMKREKKSKKKKNLFFV
jgi:myosin heavy subunit